MFCILEQWGLLCVGALLRAPVTGPGSGLGPDPGQHWARAYAGSKGWARPISVPYCPLTGPYCPLLIDTYCPLLVPHFKKSDDKEIIQD